MEWLEIKIWLESSTGLDRDALHIYGAVIIQFFFAFVFRKGLASLWPWIAVFIVAATNEYFDYQGVGESEASMHIYQAEAYKDMWNTMLIPSILLLIARFWPKWMTGKPKEPKAVDTNNIRSETVT